VATELLVKVMMVVMAQSVAMTMEQWAGVAQAQQAKLFHQAHI
jgi:hypothetical protein